MCLVKKTHQIFSDGSESRPDAAAPSTGVGPASSNHLISLESTDEFVRIGELRLLFGITRPTAYLLAKEGKIQTVLLCKPGETRGARLVSRRSARAYLRELHKEQRVAAKPQPNNHPHP